MKTLWTALITPMDGQSKIDYPTLEKLLIAQQEAGNGVLLLGSTGEGLNLEPGECREFVATAIQMNPGVPMMVGLGGIRQAALLDWLAYLEDLPVDAYLAVNPPYAKPGPRGQESWFQTLLDAASRPVMLYNIPGRSAVALNRDALANLAGHPRLWALKEASGDPREFAAYARRAPGLIMYSGDDPLLPEFVPHGARGLVSVASNVWPRATAGYVEQALAGQLTREEIHLWKQACQALFSGGNPVTVKRLQHLLGQIPSPACRPPLSAREALDEQALLAAHQHIEDWFGATP